MLRRANTAAVAKASFFIGEHPCHEKTQPRFVLCFGCLLELADRATWRCSPQFAALRLSEQQPLVPLLSSSTGTVRYWRMRPAAEFVSNLLENFCTCLNAAPTAMAVYF
jgi:hypothetical protein